MNAFNQWLFDTSTLPTGQPDWVMLGVLMVLALAFLGLLAGLLFFIRDLYNTAFLPTVRKTGRVVDHAYTPAESGTRWEVQPSHAGNAFNGINMGSTTMVPVPYHNPERYSLLVEVDRQQYWLDVSPVDYQHLQKNDEVHVLGCTGRVSRRFEAQSVARCR